MVAFLTWSLTPAAVLLVRAVPAVLVPVALEGAGDTLSAAALGQTLAVTGAVDFVRLIHTVMVTVTHPLYCDAAPIPTAVLPCGTAITVLLITQVPAVIVSITHEARIETLACVTVEHILTAITVFFVTVIITVGLAITSSGSQNTPSRATLEVTR